MKMGFDMGKLFIGGISWDTTEDHLKEYFGRYGKVLEAVIVRDRVTGRARGFGFVVFADPSVAETVVMDYHLIDGRTVEAKKAVPKYNPVIPHQNASSINQLPRPGRTKKIFVGGLASTITESSFKAYFDQFGMITDVVVMYDHNTKRPRGFGFITFDSEDAVDRVLRKAFHDLNGKMVEVKKAVPKEMSPGPMRNLVTGYNMDRTPSFLNSYIAGHNLSKFRGYGARISGRFDLGNAGSSYLRNDIRYGRILNPFYGGVGYQMACANGPRVSSNGLGISQNSLDLDTIWSRRLDNLGVHPNLGSVSSQFTTFGIKDDMETHERSSFTPSSGSYSGSYEDLYDTLAFDDPIWRSNSAARKWDDPDLIG